jgi:hypothetical protein
LKQVLVENYWTLAYRRKSGQQDLLLNDRQVTFRLFPENHRYWYADPFLFEQEGQAYLFFERYDRWSGKGQIAYSLLTNDGASEPRVILPEPHHLSFPFLFRKGEEIYLIPESGDAGQVVLYQAESFPDKWKKKKILIKDFRGTDTVVFEAEGVRWLLTSRPMTWDIHRQQLYLYEMDEDMDLTPHPGNPFGDGSSPVRAAGGMLMLDGKLLHPVQDGSTRNYGSKIIFREVSILDRGAFLEMDYEDLKASDIRLENSEAWRRYVGLHTYNQSEHYEVVDLKIRRRYPPHWAVVNLFQLVSRYCMREARKRVMVDGGSK